MVSGFGETRFGNISFCQLAPKVRVSPNRHDIYSNTNDDSMMSGTPLSLSPALFPVNCRSNPSQHPSDHLKGLKMEDRPIVVLTAITGRRRKRALQVQFYSSNPVMPDVELSF